jgi:uncharacterized membrane protein (UPF0127 family)
MIYSLIRNLLFLLIISTYFSKNVNAKVDNSNFANYQHKIQVISKENYQKAQFLTYLADNDQKRGYGLMNINKMPYKYGMYFIFDSPRIISMWMKNTKFGLDMIFIDKNDKIVNIVKNTKPFSKEIISSQFLSDKVLEINANLCKKYNIKIGDYVKLIKNENI